MKGGTNLPKKKSRNPLTGFFRQTGSLLPSLLGSVALFGILFFLFHWNFFVVMILSVGFYLALSYLFAPVKKIGTTAVEELHRGEYLSRVFDEAQRHMNHLRNMGDRIEAKDLQGSCLSLVRTGDSILTYLAGSPQAISGAEHFLEYYVESADQIVENYLCLQPMPISEEKRRQVEQSTKDSLKYLQSIFTRQLESFYDNRILKLEVESDLLEKTVKLGGGRN